jgi:hypothetical protein
MCHCKDDCFTIILKNKYGISYTIFTILMMTDTVQQLYNKCLINYIKMIQKLNANK